MLHKWGIYMEKILRGILLGALMPVGVAFAFTIIWSSLQVGATSSFVLIAVVLAVVMAIMVSAIATLVLGVPTYLLFERLRIRSPTAYVAWGAVISVALGVLLVYPTGPANAAQKSLSILVLLVALVSGPAASFVFWKIARPDLRAKNKLKVRP